MLRVGQQVHYYSDKQKYQDKKNGNAQPMLALVTFGNYDGTVNVAYFEQDGKAKNAVNVPLVAAPDPTQIPASGHFCVDPVGAGPVVA